MNRYKLKVPGKLETLYPLFEEQQLDVWHCDGSGWAQVATYSFGGKALAIHCSGEMDWRVLDPATGREERWRSGDDISLPVMTDDALLKIWDDESVRQDMNCWLEAEWANAENYGDGCLIIDGSLDAVISQCHEAIVEMLKEGE
jgi:hypothetical protein